MITVSDYDAMKMRLYGYEVIDNRVKEEDYQNYIEDITNDYIEQHLYL